MPFRDPPSYRKQKNQPGLYWFETTRRHIIYESLLEMRILQLLDFDSHVVAVAAQPFALIVESGKKRRRYVPDFFARLSSGTGRVIEVKPPHSADKPEVSRRLQIVKKACARVGWDYEVATEPNPVLMANVGWLAGFRRKPEMLGQLAESLLEAAEKGIEFDGLIQQSDHEALTRPVVFHLLWNHVLATDLTASPLSRTTVVTTTGRSWDV